MKIQKHLKVIRGKKREVIQFRRGAVVVTKSSNLTACEGVVPGSQMHYCTSRCKCAKWWQQ